MDYLSFLQFMLRIFTVILIMATIVFIYAVLKGHSYFRKLSKLVESLAVDITDEKIGEFIYYLDENYIPFYAGGMMRAGYQLVEMDESADDEIKRKLKVKLLSRGIGGI